jgi:hypothetical protein
LQLSSGACANAGPTQPCVPRVDTQEQGEFRQEFRTKEAAVSAAKERACGQEPSQVKVHTSDGNMEYESTYGEDPTRTPS